MQKTTSMIRRTGLKTYVIEPKPQREKRDWSKLEPRQRSRRLEYLLDAGRHDQAQQEGLIA